MPWGKDGCSNSHYVDKHSISYEYLETWKGEKEEYRCVDREAKLVRIFIK